MGKKRRIQMKIAYEMMKKMKILQKWVVVIQLVRFVVWLHLGFRANVFTQKQLTKLPWKRALLLFNIPSKMRIMRIKMKDTREKKNTQKKERMEERKRNESISQVLNSHDHFCVEQNVHSRLLNVITDRDREQKKKCSNSNEKKTDNGKKSITNERLKLDIFSLVSLR